MIKQLTKMAQVADSFEKQGNTQASRIVTQAMTKIAGFCDSCGRDWDRCQCEICPSCENTLAKCTCNESEEEPWGEDNWDDDDRSMFADPGGHSALRAGEREYSCPTCGEPNRLTKEDKRLGYQCDACADRAEGLGWQY